MGEGPDDTVEDHLDGEAIRMLRQKASSLREEAGRIDRYLDGEFEGDMQTLDRFLQEVVARLTNCRNTISLVRDSHELEGHNENLEEDDRGGEPDLQGESGLSGSEDGESDDEPDDHTEATDASDEGGDEDSELDEDLDSLY